MLVTIDTQTFEKLSFDFDHRLLSRFREACEDGSLDFLLVDVTVREVNRRIDARIREACGPIKKALKDAYVLTAAGLDIAGAKRDVAKPVRLIAKAQERWDQYRSACDSDELRSNEIDLDAVMDRYFAQEAPFSKAKPREFPDAIVIERLLMEAEKRGEPIHVVSGDGDFEKACDGKALIHHERLTGVLKMVLGAGSAAAESFLLNRMDQVGEEASRNVEGSLYVVEEDWDADVEINQVTVELEDPEAFEIEEKGHKTKVAFEMLASFQIDASAAVTDYANSPRDEGEFVFLNQDDLRFQVERDFPVYATVLLEDDTPVDIIEVYADTPDAIEISIEEEGVSVTKRWDEDD